jgi:hypothetical protein
MLKGIDINEQIDFVLPEDPDKDNPTIFVIGNIANDKKLSFISGTFDKDGNPNMEKLQDKMFPIIKAGLKGIKGLIDSKTGEKKDYTVIDDAVLNILESNIAGGIEIKN